MKRDYQISVLIACLTCFFGCSSQQTASKNQQTANVSPNATVPSPESVVLEVATNENAIRASTSEKHSNDNSDLELTETTNENDLTDPYEAPERFVKFDENTIKQTRYRQLSESEKMLFIQKRMNHISFLIANEKYYFNTEEDKKALQIIKYWIDELQKRVGNRAGSRLWGGDLNLLFSRGKKYAPTIIQAAKKRNVPKIVPLYIAAIETEYTNVSGENQAGAAGLFQFIPSTARLYGINPSERTNVTKMADAAALYIGDRMKEFGNDTRSVALCIAGYNRSPDNVRRDLHAVLEITDNKEKDRSFWTMIENEDDLIRRFGERERKYYRENMPYVPRFFAFAIIGETPWAFDIDLEQALSTYEN